MRQFFCAARRQTWRFRRADAGVECWCVDIQHSIRKPVKQGNINFVWGDVRSWIPPEGLNILFVFAFPPCTHVAVSGARDFETKGGNMLRDSLETFEACRMVCAWSGARYGVEQPVGVLSSLPHIGKPDYYFDPCDYGDTYTKKTCLWTGNGFVMPPKNPVKPVDGSKMHLMAPGEGRADKRAETPMGFALAAFYANAPEYVRLSSPDHPCEIRPNGAHPGARSCSACAGFWMADQRVECGKGRKLPDYATAPNEPPPLELTATDSENLVSGTKERSSDEPAVAVLKRERR